MDKVKIPSDQQDIGSFRLLKENIDIQLSEIIHGASKQSNLKPFTISQQVGDFYKSGMDVDRINKLGIKPIQKDLKQADVAVGSPKALAEFNVDLMLRYGASPILNVIPDVDQKINDRYILQFLLGMNPLSQDEYLNPEQKKVQDDYVDYINKILLASGEKKWDAKKNSQLIFNIEKQIAEISLTPIQLRDPVSNYHKMTLEEVQKLIPFIDVKQMLNKVNIEVGAFESVLVRNPKGLIGTTKIIENLSKDELAEFLRWRIYLGSIGSLGEPWHSIDQEFTRQRSGIQQNVSHEREIIEQTTSLLAHPVSKLYVKNYFNESTRNDVTEMVKNIKNTFKQRISNNQWLDEKTRNAALLKIDKIDIQVGYPEDWIDYSSVLIKPDDYLGNVQRIRSFSTMREFNKLGKPVINERFAVANITTPTSVNAAYMPTLNAVDISAAILQTPFYQPAADKAINYCTMGAVIGHELTHGFDSMGRNFDENGKLNNWWADKAAIEFKKKTDMLVEQYNQYEVLPDIKQNGALTVTENTADVGGIAIAFSALEKDIKNHPSDYQEIDGLSPEQRCFIAWSQLWSFKARPERIKTLVNTDYHSNGNVRAIAPLLHLDGFFKAFDIKEGNQMWYPPKKRVTIW
ncbi:putative metalloendopeptidase [Acinetobacter sp. NBRC 100985]|nr:putative metalloendopeptidase [Acinetobacter sp. NBRC 100985]